MHSFAARELRDPEKPDLSKTGAALPVRCLTGRGKCGMIYKYIYVHQNHYQEDIL